MKFLVSKYLTAFLTGFPDHPHRGFETVTYVLPFSKGSVEHEDFVGHKGKIGPGDLQWMTAGRGILHSEMPFSKEVKCIPSSCNVLHDILTYADMSWSSTVDQFAFKRKVVRTSISGTLM